MHKAVSRRRTRVSIKLKRPPTNRLANRSMSAKELFLFEGTSTVIDP